MKVTIAILDGHPIIRMGLKKLIEYHPNYTVVAEAGSVEEVSTALDGKKVDVAVLDISLKNGGGVDLIRRIKETNSPIGVLVFSSLDEDLYAEASIRAGAGGYIMKSAPVDVFLAGIEQVLRGEICLSRPCSDRMFNNLFATTQRDSDDTVLSARELEVLNLIGEGNTTSNIATWLDLSVKTIETYKAKIKSKLGIENGMKLIQYASIQYYLEHQSLKGDAVISAVGEPISN